MPNLEDFFNKPSIEENVNLNLEKILGEKPCSTCDKNSDFFFWDSSTLTMTWECPDGHKNSFRIQ